MTKTFRLARINVMQTAKVAAALYLLIGVIAAIVAVLVALFGDADGRWVGLVFALFAPLLYAVAGFVVVAIGCWIYNLVAGWVGGVEWEMEERSSL